MANSFLPLPAGVDRFLGYRSQTEDVDPSYLAPPSSNCLVTKAGKAESRLGYTEEFSIGVDGSSATSIYLKTYDVAFFALGTKVFYRDFIQGATYDTGITLTAGTVTRFAEWFGMIFLTNTTDGLKLIICGRLNDAAANAGDATVTIDMDMGGRLSAFTLTADNLRVNGTNEDMASIDVATGVVTLNVNLSQSYADNTFAIVVKNITSEKFSKVEFWKNRLHGMGFPSASNADQPNNTVMAGQFASAQTIELIVDFTYGTGGATKIVVGGGGAVKNILGVDDNIWFLNEDKTFNTANTAVTTTGAAIGATEPIERDKNHGCLSEDCAIAIGNGEMSYISNDRRIMRQRIATDTGAAVAYPDEYYDSDIAEHLKNMDKDQTGALAFHYRGQRKSIYQIKIIGQWYWFIFDHNIVRNVNGAAYVGAWQPPQSIAPVSSFFERNGVLYGTDSSDDTVYSYFTAFTDNLNAIEVTIATGNFNVGHSMMNRAQLRGEVNQPSEITINCYVTNKTGGRRTGSAKIILGSDYSYSADKSVGALPAGGSTSIGETTEIADWDMDFGIMPSEATRAQLIATNSVDGGYYSVSAFGLTGQQYANSFQPSK